MCYIIQAITIKLLPLTKKIEGLNKIPNTGILILYLPVF